uniref:Uncharacterized protein n=2 Tax=viral metagenome TaxID=1070528 RepID=A0A6M3K8M7_9ZZZZ
MRSVISGINCEVDGVSSMSGWKIRMLNMPPEFATSDAPGGMGRAAGNFDWRGVYRAYGHTPLHWPGDSIAFKGDTDASYGVSATGIVDRMTITCPIEPGGLIDTVVEFSNNDAAGLVNGAAAATAGATPAIFSAVTRKIAWSGTDVSARNWRLVLTARNRPYVDTDTDGWVMRTPGNMDGQFEYSVYDNAAANLPARGSIAVAQFYVTASTYWELTWGIIERVDDWGGDHEGAENVFGNVFGFWTAQSGTSIGTIKNPAGATKWPT